MFVVTLIRDNEVIDIFLTQDKDIADTKFKAMVLEEDDKHRADRFDRNCEFIDIDGVNYNTHGEGWSIQITEASQNQVCDRSSVRM